jgi:anaphase-promoting complex subunit 10
VPHTINIQFYKRQSVAEVALRLSLKQDESYTPEKITIRAGNLLTDLEPVRGIKVGEVEGWLRIPLGNPERLGLQRYLRTHFLQISVSQMHQQGRDTHIRGIKVLGPPVTASAPSAMRVGLPQWEDDSFLSPGVLR